MLDESAARASFVRRGGGLAGLHVFSAECRPFFLSLSSFSKTSLSFLTSHGDVQRLCRLGITEEEEGTAWSEVVEEVEEDGMRAEGQMAMMMTLILPFFDLPVKVRACFGKCVMHRDDCRASASIVVAFSSEKLGKNSSP